MAVASKQWPKSADAMGMQISAADQAYFSAYQTRVAIDVAVLKEAKNVSEQQGDAAVQLLEQAAQLARGVNEAARASRGIDLVA